ncbi:MAG: hypothetical protein D3906_04340 [Candidatus Electrothrix sp. AUS1_2]|nr:hypothetical protein [Candidatus Electrothrix sp. AUS1_2]
MIGGKPMVWKKKPEDGEELSPVTRVILNDLKGRREIHHDFRKKNHFQQKKKPPEKEEITDHNEWMPKQIPQAMRQTIRNTEKPRKKAEAPKRKVLLRKRKESFEYVVQLRSGKTLRARRVIIRSEEVLLTDEEMKMTVPAKSVKWIRETRIRVLTLES